MSSNDIYVLRLQWVEKKNQMTENECKVITSLQLKFIFSMHFFLDKEVLLNRKESTEGDDKDQRKMSEEGKSNEVQPASPNEYLKWQHHQKLS